TDDFRQGSGVAGEDRRAAGHRLDGRQAEPFQERRLDQGIRAAVQEDEVLVRDESRQEYAMPQVLARDRRADGGYLRVEDVVDIAGQHEPDVRPGRSSEGVDEAGQILMRA